MKKFLLLVVMFFIPLFAFADEISDVRAFFDKYVNAANNYSYNLTNFYATDAKIIRVVMKKDGTTKTLTTDMNEYAKQLKMNAGIAKMRKYKNYYSNIKVSKVGNDYKITCSRQPSTSDYKIPAHFIIRKTANGQYKIVEESMHTKVQAFLLHADK